MSQRCRNICSTSFPAPLGAAGGHSEWISRARQRSRGHLDPKRRQLRASSTSTPAVSFAQIAAIRCRRAEAADSSKATRGAENINLGALCNVLRQSISRRRALRRRSELARVSSGTRHSLFVVFRFSDFGLSDDQTHHRCCRSQVKDHCRLLREAASSQRTSAPLPANSVIRNRSASHLRAIVRARFIVSSREPFQ